MPRLRLAAKVVLALLGFVVMFKVMNTKPPESVDVSTDPVPPPPASILTEQELIDQTMEASKRQDWAWKDFPM